MVNSFFKALTLFRVSVGLSHVLLSSLAQLFSSLEQSKKINNSLADGSISDRRKLVDTLEGWNGRQEMVKKFADEGREDRD